MKILIPKWKVISKKIKQNSILIGVLVALATPYIFLNYIYPGFLGNGTIAYKNKIYTWITYDTNWHIDYDAIGTEIKVHVNGTIGKYSATLYDGGDFIRLERTGDLYYRTGMEFPKYDNPENIEKIVVEVIGTIYNEGYKDIILEGEEINLLLEEIRTFDEKKANLKMKDINDIANVNIYYDNFPAYWNAGCIFEKSDGTLGLYRWEESMKKVRYIEFDKLNFWE